MGKLRFVAAYLLGVPLLVFGLNHFLHLFEMTEPEGQADGIELLQAMRAGGLMGWVAASHVILGGMLLVRRLQFLAGAMQLPLSVGILGVHVAMLPEGTALAAVLVALNAVVVANPAAIHAVLKACST